VFGLILALGFIPTISQAFQDSVIRPTNTTASRLVSTDSGKKLISSDLADWLAGTTNQITVTDDLDGTATLSTPQDIHTAASPTFTGLTLSGLTASRLTATDGSKGLISSDLANWIAGSASITVTDDGDGSVTLSAIAGGIDHDSLSGITENNHHNRLHTMTSASDHSGGNDKIFYSGNAGAINELPLGSQYQVLISNGENSTPSFANQCPSTDTLPASANTGDCRIYTPTGSSQWLYNGSAWTPTHTISSITLYVGAQGGADTLTTQNRGTSSVPFATIQAALDACPPDGDCTIYVAKNNAGSDSWTNDSNGSQQTYSENLSLSKPDLTIIGTLIEQTSATQDSSVQGSSATQGSITDTGNFGAYDDLLIYSSNNAEYRIIDSDTADTATIVGVWSAAPTGTYTVYDWGVIISGGSSNPAVVLEAETTNYALQDLEITSSTTSGIFPENMTFKPRTYSSGMITRCNILNSSSGRSVYGYEPASAEFDTCIIDSSTGHVFQLSASVRSFLYRCKLTPNGTRGVWVVNADIGIRYGTIISGGSNCIEDRASLVNMFSANAEGWNRITSCTTGILASQGGIAINVGAGGAVGGNVYYNANGTDYNPAAAADPAYIVP